jgi:hypothetical protein
MHPKSLTLSLPGVLALHSGPVVARGGAPHLGTTR